MKKNSVKSKINGARFVLTTAVSMFAGVLFSQQTYSFTTCGATGQAGPNQGQVSAAYTTGNTLNGQVTVSGQGIQLWVVPASGNYKIQAVGASGGSSQY